MRHKKKIKIAVFPIAGMGTRFLPITKTRCSKTLNVICYLTSLKKKLPVSNLTILGANNANTAFTHRCPEKGEIIMYRKEEIFKVFIDWRTIY